MVGSSVGSSVGASVGSLVGCMVGSSVGSSVGASVANGAAVMTSFLITHSRSSHAQVELQLPYMFHEVQMSVLPRPSTPSPQPVPVRLKAVYPLGLRRVVFMKVATWSLVTIGALPFTVT